MAHRPLRSFAIAFILLAGAGAPRALANAGGIVGYTGLDPAVTCRTCHAIAAGVPAPTALITGPSTLKPGEVGNYAFTLTGGPGVRAGINIGASNPAAVLAAVSANTAVIAGEVYQTSPLTFSGGSVTVQFRLTAPATAGTLTINASGNSCNGNGNTGGDHDATTQLAVTVSSGPNAPPSVAQAAAASANPVTGKTVTLSALGADDGGEAALVYTWSAPGAPAVVAFSGNGNNAAKSTVATFSRAGTYTLLVGIRDAAGQTVTSSVSVVVNQAVAAVAVSPSSASVAQSATQQFNAVAQDQFGASVAPAPAFTWAVSGGGTISATGLFTAGATLGGPHLVTAAAAGKSGTASVTVSAGGAPTVAQAPRADANPVLGSSVGLSVLGADDGGEAALTYSWSAVSAPGPVAFGANGTNAAKAVTASFTRAGAYTLQVSIKDAGNQVTTATLNLDVSPVLTSLSVSPATAGIPLSGTQQFNASGLDQFAAPMVMQPAVSWTVAGGGTISAAGLFTAGAVTGGPFTVTATGGGKTGTATVSISSGAPPTVVQPATAANDPVFGKSVGLSVLGSDDGGAAALLYSWSAPTAPAPVVFSANGTNAARATVATFTKAGTYVLLATVKDGGNLTATSSVTVSVNQALTAVVVSPAAVTLKPTMAQAFTASVQDQFGAPVAPQPAVLWSTTGGGALSAQGVYQAGAVPGGPHSVIARIGGLSAMASVTVGAGDAPTLTEAPAPLANPVTDRTVTLRATAADDGGEANLVYTWVALTAPAPVIFGENGNNAAKLTTVSFSVSGDYRFEVTVKDAGGQTATGAVDVRVESMPKALAIEPRTATVAPGGTLRFAAVGRDQFNAVLATPPSVTWTAQGGGAVDAAGTFTAAADEGGPFTLTAALGTLSAAAQVTVSGKPPVGNGPDVTAPGLAWVGPYSDSPLHGAVELEVLVNDDVGVAEVTFLVDGVPVGKVTRAPWVLPLDTTTLQDGAHGFLAEARDAAGNAGRSTEIFQKVENNPLHDLVGEMGCSAGGSSAFAWVAAGILAQVLLRRRRPR